MTTTTTFSGMDPSGRNSSRVLRPPGGGSNFSLGFDEPKEQPVRRNKMASSIFGTPEENPPSWAKSSGTKPGEIREDSESSGPQRRNSTDANCGDFVDPKGGDGGGETSALRLKSLLCKIHLKNSLLPGERNVYVDQILSKCYFQHLRVLGDR
ncbi:jupiter microtubule associated homolog 1 isoform X2 [Egretta garzetta]|uniref:jupiter microtubule associated homolog 1 isoform X2 n=1 Tax=Egretta garzetta TaxID=188379 RepID=UPI00163C2B11|nr:jupiter microtubule associated homolog 1 isoform X2 [Egretta garzetta]